jgi:ABC-type antimicrobial peptide transport system permease subunit
VFGLVFCSMVVVVFWLVPAIRASRLRPIDALRYE